jgi:ADP-ribose pyrophosphatase YjhB (NUDIX family)
MDRDYPAHPLPAVIAMVARGDHVLLARRGKGVQPDPWGFPGGLLEVGETVLEGAARELLEETGVRARPEAVMEVVDVIVRDDDGRVRSHFVLNAVRMTWLAGEPRAASDAIAADWFTLEQIGAMPCHPHLPRLAAALLAQLAP